MNSNLYLLVFPELNALKIGKANEIQQRYEKLRSVWGNADLKASYSISISESNVFKLERALHFFFQDYNKKYDCGDGHTEFFDLSILDKVLDLLKQISSFSINQFFDIKKGIDMVTTIENNHHFLSKEEKYQQRMNKQKQEIEKISSINQNTAIQFLCNINELFNQFKYEVKEYNKKQYISFVDLSKEQSQYISNLFDSTNNGFRYLGGGFNIISSFIIRNNEFLFNIQYSQDDFQKLMSYTQNEEEQKLIQECEFLIKELYHLTMML